MEILEILELIFKPLIHVLHTLLRVLSFLAWDIGFSCIGWSIGWVFYRLVSFGHFPEEEYKDLDNCSFSLALFVEITGLIILGGLIFLLARII